MSIHIARPDGGGQEVEIGRAGAKCPDAHYVGIADGAKGNWEFLGRHTDVQVTDFWHAAEYLGKAAVVIHRGHPRTKEAWLEEACHRLKHEPGGAEWVLKQLRRLARERPWAKDDEDVQRAITYFANQSGTGRMDYASRVAASLAQAGSITVTGTGKVTYTPDVGHVTFGVNSEDKWSGTIETMATNAGLKDAGEPSKYWDGSFAEGNGS